MFETDKLIEIALREDIGDGDITTSSIVSTPLEATAHLVAKEGLILAGIDIFHRVYKKLDADLELIKHFEDGDEVSQGSIIGEISGEVAVILKGERIALNFLQRLSGIATLTHKFVMKVKSYPVKILDTRKTTPGWRALEKYAVKMGGGENHRFGLFDAVLIKDNHISAAGGIGEAVRRVKDNVPHSFKIEVETSNLQEVKEALDSGVNTIMLDNMSTEMMKEAVAVVNKRVLVEASGNTGLDNIEEIAAAGVDFISVGALTHSAKAVDISLKVVENT
ncbi:MAG: carboxylating nicotinate-nucleotide diphosphorylase [Deltaproteobacteria bacterium]|nr:carboxylating nicotinate-nucleotide diphosphorylase [Deltaproteobacteria bacterium]MCK5422219.1 carboxylating nicotinate-nucleotide diphosphorylase [Deltaproteobacteria bacterium]